MPNTSNDPETTQTPAQGTTARHRGIRVTSWMPIPRSNILRKMMNMTRNPDWAQGHMYKFTTDAFRHSASESWKQVTKHQIGYVWAGKGKIVLRWRGKSYHWNNDRPMWETVEHVISTVAG